MRENLVYLLPGQGQGSVAVGMGKELYENSEFARSIFDEADKYLGKPISNLCFLGPEGELRRTKHAQLASFLVSVACFAELYRVKVVDGDLEPIKEEAPDFLAGHSVGEIAAMVCAKVITFHEGLDIIDKARGPLLEEACRLTPGRMTALFGGDNKKIKALMKRHGLGGNFNSDHIVISGPLKEMAEAEKEIRECELCEKPIPLKVEGGFHSVCMESAREPFKKYLKGIKFRKPQIPLIGNSRAQIIKTGRQARRELARQICLPVRWHDSMEVLRKKEKVTIFIELGYGKVLSSGLRKRRGYKRLLIVSVGAVLLLGLSYYFRRKKRVTSPHSP